jgi:hypothetical protein
LKIELMRQRTICYHYNDIMLLINLDLKFSPRLLKNSCKTNRFSVYFSVDRVNSLWKNHF